MKRNKLGLTVAAGALFMLILDSRSAADAAAMGVDACIKTVIPALFPFFVLSGYLTSGLGNGMLSNFIGRLFHLPPNCSIILLTGLLGGYPVGANLAAAQYRTGNISKAQADRLIMFCSQAGPSFLFGIAAAQLGSIQFGWLLWGIQILSAWYVALLFPVPNHVNEHHIQPRAVSWSDAMRTSLSAMASVCGWVILFSVVIRFLSRWVLWILPSTLQILLCGLLELTNGCLMLTSIEDSQLRFLLAAVMLNFGGLCVVMQTASIAKELNLKRYLLGKVIQTGICVLFALSILGYFYFLLPLIVVFFNKLFGFYRNRGRNLRLLGV